MVFIFEWTIQNAEELLLMILVIINIMRYHCMSLIILIFIYETIAVEFTSWPDVRRTVSQSGAEVELVWTTDFPRDAGDTTTLLNPSGHLVIDKLYSLINYGPGYDATLVEYTGSGTRVSFVLKYPRDAAHFIGNYTCSLTLTVSDPGNIISNSWAVLYQYATPTPSSLTPTSPEQDTGTSITLHCVSRSTSMPSAYRPVQLSDSRWYLNNTDITNSMPDRHMISGLDLSIVDLRPHDRFSSYRCRAAEGGLLSYFSGAVTINVLYPPQRPAITPPSSFYIAGMDTLTLECLWPDDHGNPAAERLVWRRGTDPEIVTSDGRHVVAAGDVTVASHDGLWRCWAQTASGDNEGEAATVTVVVNKKPGLTSDLRDRYEVLISGDLSVMSCSFNAKPVAAVTWTHNGGALPQSVTVFHNTTTVDGIAVTKSWLQWTGLESGRRLAGGQYQCQASSIIGSSSSKTSTLVTKYGPASVTLNTTLEPLTEGQTLSVLCSSDCSPGCDFVWKLGSTTFSTSPVITLMDITRDQHGQVVSCRASNPYSTKTSPNFALSVNYVPSITELKTSDEAPTEGDQVTLSCTVDSRPVSQMLFLNVTRGQNVPIEPTSVVDNVATYVIPDATCLHSGSFKCQANNDLGRPIVSDDSLGITVSCAPSTYFVRPELLKISSAVGEKTTLEVGLVSYPLEESHLSWTFASLKLTAKREIFLVGVILLLKGNVARLDIFNTTTEHFGNYTLTVNNNIGQPLVVTFEVSAITGGPDLIVILAPTLTVLVLTIIIVLAVVFFLRCKKQREQQHSPQDNPEYVNIEVRHTVPSKGHDHSEKGTNDTNYEMLSNAKLPSSMDTGVSTYERLESHILPTFSKFEVALTKFLSEGRFVDVWAGKPKTQRLLPKEVVIKEIKGDCDVMTKYLDSVASCLRKSQHIEYVIQCYGIHEGLMIVELAPRGDLRQHLQSLSSDIYTHAPEFVTEEPIMSYVSQVVAGAAQISRIKPPVLHYCFCASHVFLFPNHICKLTGFAGEEQVRAREAWEAESKIIRPVRWLAPEAIELNHTQRSDVWSLAITVWEILNGGTIHLTDVTDEEAAELVKDGHHPSRTTKCTREMYSLLTRCWEFQPGDRPSAEEVLQRLADITQYETL